MLPRQVIKGFPEKDETRCFVVHGSVKSNTKRRDETRRDVSYILTFPNFWLRIPLLVYTLRTALLGHTKICSAKIFSKFLL